MRALFELILDVIPAERGAMVLTEDTGGSLPPLLAWNKDQGSPSLRICKQMTDRVLREGLALSSNGVVSQNDARSSVGNGSFLDRRGPPAHV